MARVVNADAPRTRLSAEVRDLGLQDFVLALEVDGLCVVPAEVHGVPIEDFHRMTELLLRRSEELVGCPFDLTSGPTVPVDFPQTRSALNDADTQPEQLSQFLIQQLTQVDRVFRDLAVNPIAVALIRHLIGNAATRFSSTNAFVKWQGDHGYGKNLGLHCDQLAVPLPWGRNAMTANTNWCLTDYTLDGGALAYIPGSHRRQSPPVFPEAVRLAVPVEVPLGSMIVFHGATWHGAFPRMVPGMRLSVANYYRHLMVLPQEDIKNSFPVELADDCANPALFKTLAGFSDVFPYTRPNEQIPAARPVGS